MKYKISIKKLIAHIFVLGIFRVVEGAWESTKEFSIYLIKSLTYLLLIIFAILYLPFRFIYVLFREPIDLIKYKNSDNQEMKDKLVKRGYFIERKFINESNNKV